MADAKSKVDQKVHPLNCDGCDAHSAKGGRFVCREHARCDRGRGTFTFDELREDLEAAGFTGTAIVRRDEGMNSILSAEKPAS